jgi:uncharacterized membrane protein YbhN (UPF0104 family)
MDSAPAAARSVLRSKRLQSILLWGIGIGILLGFAYYLYANADEYIKLLNVSVRSVILLFLLCLTFPLINGLQNTLLYRRLSGPEFSQRDGFLVTAASNLANQLPVPGGIVSKGVYLKHMYDLSYAKFTSSTIALFCCFLAVNGAVGLSILLYWMLFKNITASPILWIGYALMMACLLVFLIPFDRMRIPTRLRRWLEQAIEGWVVISGDPVLLLQLVGLQTVLVAMLSLRYWLAFRMVSQNVSMGQALLFASASVLTQLVTIAPGGLGVREAAVGTVAALLGVSPVVSVVAVGLDRLVITVMIILTGGVSTVILGRQIADASVQQGDEAP